MSLQELINESRSCQSALEVDRQGGYAIASGKVSELNLYNFFTKRSRALPDTGSFHRSVPLGNAEIET